MSVTPQSVIDRPRREELYERWERALSDPVLRNLAYRIEVNQWGHLEMTPPASPRHMDIACAVAALLRERFGGKAFTECAILTSGGVRSADVVWCSETFITAHREELDRWAAAFSAAPELCIEVMSPSNTYAELEERVGRYLSAGAREAWILGSDGQRAIFGPEGRRALSEWIPEASDWMDAIAPVFHL